MSVHGHATVWGTPISIGCAKDPKCWYQQLKEWWTAHKAARQEAHLAAIAARWDAKREALKPLPADAAADMAAAQSGLSMAVMLYGFAS